MLPPPSAHAADALALLLRQRDLQPHMTSTERLALSATSREMMQATYPHRPPDATGRGCLLLAAQLGFDVPSRRLIASRLDAALRPPNHGMHEHVLSNCRDLLWRGDAWRTNTVRHEVPPLPPEQRRQAIALMSMACRGIPYEEALTWVDAHRAADWFTILPLLAADAAAVGVAGGSLYGAYLSLRTASATAQAARHWWSLGGILGAVGGVGFGVVTGGLGGMATVSVSLGANYVAAHLAEREEKRVGVPYSVRRDLVLCELVTHRRHLHPA